LYFPTNLGALEGLTTSGLSILNRYIKELCEWHMPCFGGERTIG